MSSRKEKNRRRNVGLFKKAYLAFSNLRIRFQFLTLGIILSSLFIILLAVDNRQLITSKAASILCDDQSWYCLGECASASVRKIFTDTWKPKGIDPATQWRQEKSGGKPYLCNPSNNPPVATVRPSSSAPSQGGPAPSVYVSQGPNLPCDDQSWYCLGECASASVRQLFNNTYGTANGSARWRNEKSQGNPASCFTGSITTPNPSISVYAYPTYIPVVIRTTPAPTVTPVNDPQCKNVGNITKLHCCGGSSYCQRHGPGRMGSSVTYSCEKCEGSNICRENYGCIYQACQNAADKTEKDGQYYACFKYGSNPGFLVQVKPEFYNSSYPANADEVYKNLSVAANAVSSFDQMLARNKMYGYYLGSEASTTIFDKAGVAIVAGLDNLYYNSVGRIGQAASVGLGEITGGAIGDTNAQIYSSYGQFKLLQMQKIQEAIVTGKDFEDITDFSHLPQMAQIFAAGMARYAGLLTFGLLPGPEKIVNATIDNIAGSDPEQREYADEVIYAITDAINIGFLAKDAVNPYKNYKLAQVAEKAAGSSKIVNAATYSFEPGVSEPVRFWVQRLYNNVWVWDDLNNVPMDNFVWQEGQTVPIRKSQLSIYRYSVKPPPRDWNLAPLGKLKPGDIIWLNKKVYIIKNDQWGKPIIDFTNPINNGATVIFRGKVYQAVRDKDGMFTLKEVGRQETQINPPRTSTISRVGSFASNVKNGQDAAFATNVPNQIRKAYLVVADGHGVGGEIASQIAVSKFDGYIQYYASAGYSPTQIFQSTIKALDDDIVRRTSGGTTFTAAVYRGSDLYIAHLGDSRLYLLRNGKFQPPLTQDHNWPGGSRRYGIMVSKSLGDIGIRQAATAQDALNYTSPDIITIEVKPGDILIAGSDGLTHYIDHNRGSFSFIKQAIDSYGPEQAAPIIANYAAVATNNADDISVAILQIGQ